MIILCTFFITCFWSQLAIRLCLRPRWNAESGHLLCRAAEVQMLNLCSSCLSVADLNIIHYITIWLFLPNHPVYCILNCNEFPGVCLCLRWIHNEQEWIKDPANSRQAFNDSQTNTKPSNFLHIHLAIYFSTECVLHHYLTLHLLSSFISIIINLYFLPL